MTDIEWASPPKRQKMPGSGRKRAYTAEADATRANPGQWCVLRRDADKPSMNSGTFCKTYGPGYKVSRRQNEDGTYITYLMWLPPVDGSAA